MNLHALTGSPFATDDDVRTLLVTVAEQANVARDQLAAVADDGTRPSSTAPRV